MFLQEPFISGIGGLTEASKGNFGLLAMIAVVSAMGFAIRKLYADLRKKELMMMDLFQKHNEKMESMVKSTNESNNQLQRTIQDFDRNMNEGFKSLYTYLQNLK